MELKINIVEAAAELAEGRVRSYFEKQIPDHFNDDAHIEALEKLVYQDDDSGGTIYTDSAQDLFCLFYDTIFEQLIQCKVTKIPNLFNCRTIFDEDLVDSLAKKATEKKMKAKYLGKTEQFISNRTWVLGELNNLEFTPQAQKIYDEAKEYYQMQITQFEI